MTKEKPNLCLIATGGTIAGRLVDPDAGQGSYQSGQLPVTEMLSCVPEVLERANWQVRQPYQIGSQHATFKHWIILRQSLIEALQSPDIHGVLVTHGTDTLECVMYFLWVTLPPTLLESKPVVFTSSMRTMDHHDSDAVTNLVDSSEILFKLVGHPTYKTVGGMLLCMNGKLIPPLDVRKTHTSDVGAFDCSSAYDLTEVLSEQTWHLQEVRAVFADSTRNMGEFHSLDLFELEDPELMYQHLSRPRIELLYCHPGMSASFDQDSFLSCLIGHTDVLVLAAFGNGSIPNYLEPGLRELVESGTHLVKASRVLAGGVGVVPPEPGGLDDLYGQTDKHGLPVFRNSGDLSLNQVFVYERLRWCAEDCLASSNG